MKERSGGERIHSRPSSDGGREMDLLVFWDFFCHLAGRVMHSASRRFDKNSAAISSIRYCLSADR
jgi:hypothetical protein